MTTTVSTPAVETIQDIKNRIDVRKATDKMSLESAINALRDFHATTNAYVEKMEEKMPSIIAALESMGLGVQNFSYGKTGMDSNKWSPDDNLRVSITAVAKSNKFRFIQFAGYDRGGIGRNRERLSTKASKMAEVIKTKADLTSVQINSCSLEYKNESDSKRVLIEIWIK